MENKKWLKLFLIIPAILFVILIAYMIIDKNNGSIEDKFSDYLGGYNYWDDYSDDYDSEYDDYDNEEIYDSYKDEIASEFTIIDTEEFINYFNNNSADTKIVFIGSESCSHCQDFAPVLEEVVETMYFEIDYLDNIDITREQSERIKKIDPFLNKNIGVTPLLVVIKDGKFYKGLVGYHDYDYLVNFFENADIL